MKHGKQGKFISLVVQVCKRHWNKKRNRSRVSAHSTCVIPKADGKKGVSAGNIYKQVAALEKISKVTLPTPLQKSVLSSLKT